MVLCTTTSSLRQTCRVYNRIGLVWTPAGHNLLDAPDQFLVWNAKLAGRWKLWATVSSCPKTRKSLVPSTCAGAPPTLSQPAFPRTHHPSWATALFAVSGTSESCGWMGISSRGSLTACRSFVGWRCLILGATPSRLYRPSSSSCGPCSTSTWKGTPSGLRCEVAELSGSFHRCLHTYVFSCLFQSRIIVAPYVGVLPRKHPSYRGWSRSELVVEASVRSFPSTFPARPRSHPA